MSSEASAMLTGSAAGIPGDDGGPVFREPWEAQAFAMTATLTEQGLVSASEWSAALGREIKRAQAAGDADACDSYYLHWLAALERLVVEKGLTTAAALTASRDAWKAAARRTPHGKPIELTQSRPSTDE